MELIASRFIIMPTYAIFRKNGTEKIEFRLVNNHHILISESPLLTRRPAKFVMAG
jgi:hypothetical protein